MNVQWLVRLRVMVFHPHFCNRGNYFHVIKPTLCDLILIQSFSFVDCLSELLSAPKAVLDVLIVLRIIALKGNFRFRITVFFLMLSKDTLASGKTHCLDITDAFSAGSDP